MPGSTKSKKSPANKSKSTGNAYSHAAKKARASADHKDTSIMPEIIDFRQLFKKSPYAIVVLDLKGFITSFNSTTLRITGLTEKELRGKHFTKISSIQLHDIPRFAKIFGSLLRGKVPKPFEVSFLHKDGSTRWGEVSVALVKQDGKISGIQAVIRDISQHKRLEEYLEKERQELELIVDSSPVIVFYKDKEGKFLRVNYAFSEALQMPAEKFIGKTVFDLYSVEIAQSMTKDDQEVFNSGRPKLNIIERYESASGIRWVQTDKIPIFDKGNAIGLIGFAQDITERRQAEDALQESESRHRLLIENASECISVVQDGVVKFTNPQFNKLTGYSPEELKTASPTNLIHPDDKKMVMEYHAKRMRGEHVSNSYTLRMVDRKGNIKWLDRNITDINWEGNRAALVFDTDITERKMAEEMRHRYEHIISTTKDLMSFIDKNYIYQAVNESHYKAHGRSGADIIGHSAAELWGQETFEKAIKGYIDRCLAGEELNYESWINYPSLGKRYMQVTYYPFTDSSGDIQGVVVCSLDITERKLMEDELNLRAKLLDGANDSITLRDFEGNILYANEKAISTTGYSKEEFININVQQLSTEQDKLKGKILKKLLKEGSALFEDIILRKDGNSFPVEINSMIIELEGRKLILNVARDVTERKHMEWSLRKNEQRLKEAEKLGKLGNWEFDITTQKLEWSDQVYRLYQRDKALGPPTPEEEAQYYSPEEAERLREFARMATETGKEQEYEVTAKLPGGKIAFFHCTMRPVKDARGQVTSLFGTVQDITERKQAETALKESEIKYRSLFEDSKDPIYVTSREGKFLDFNQATVDLLGYSKKELMDLSLAKIYANPEDHQLLQAIEALGSVKDYEVQLRKKDGSLIDCLVSDIVWRHQDGSIGGYRGIIHDITYLKEAEEEHRKNTEKLLEAMKSTVSAMAKTTEIRDPYTSGHQKRVANLASAIARELNMSETQIEGIYLVGIIHDIGKMYVPSDILNRPGKLSELEFGIIKTHAQAGYDILKDIEFPWNIKDAVLNHHERIDGSGYPRGLSGKDLSLEAKILAVADVVEAMASHRPYRPALGIDEALEEIRQNRDKLYDPDVVDACVKLFTEKWFKLEE